MNKIKGNKKQMLEQLIRKIISWGALFKGSRSMNWCKYIRASLVAQTVKNLPVMQETQVWPLSKHGREFLTLFQNSALIIPYGMLLLSFGHQVTSDSFRLLGLQNTSFPGSSPSPGVYSSSCPLHWWRHPAITSSATLFSLFNILIYKTCPL